MESALRTGLHTLTLAARRLMTDETAQLLEGVYGLHADGRFEEASILPAVTESEEGRETRPPGAVAGGRADGRTWPA